jgi:phospholipid/cholesterol/gamma-HCH transport system substrate-binding protein
MQQLNWLRNPTTWGAGVLALAAVIGLVTALLYISPLGQKTVTFYTDDAASLTPGDQVRIAGITVGTVKNLVLESDRVRVNARVDATAFVGDKSQVQVRMLTVVGGYYVTIVSLGEAPLGAKPIPADRVTMPYNLMRTLADATKITDNVSTKPINESLNQIQAGLSGTNTESLSAAIDAGNSLMSAISRQRGQVSAILNMSDEYLESLTGFREELKQMVLKVALVEQTLTLYGKGFAGTLDGLGKILVGLRPVGVWYRKHRPEFLEKVRSWEQRGRLFLDRNGLTIRSLHRIQDKINRILDAQDGRPELLATDLCIPVPGSAC